MGVLVVSSHDLPRERGNIRMREEFCKVEGKVISAENLKVSKAGDFAKAIGDARYACLVECKRTTSGCEIIVFDVEVQVGQKTVNDIRRFERIAVVFEGSDTKMPEVLALRCDFPHVPHLNRGLKEFPRNLCITEQKYNEKKLRWTGVTFVEEIRQWLALTAKGILHADDQPLEPLLLGSVGELILPFDLLTKTTDAEFLSISVVDSGKERCTLIAEYPESVNENANRLDYVATIVCTSPQPHGVLRRTPTTLFELHEFLKGNNTDLLNDLRNRIRAWESQLSREKISKAKLVLIICLPKTRNENSTPETTEICAFLTSETIQQVSIGIGLSAKDGKYVVPLLPIDHSKKGNEVRVYMLNPVSSFSREHAAQLNGLSSRNSSQIAAVGLGALGSQVFLNLIRAGYGEWTLIDDDFLLPHNLARHALPSVFIGCPKSRSMAELANRAIQGDSIADSIVVDVLNSETCAEVTEAFSNADFILDASASIPVARHLVHDVDASARRISIFLNPSGTDVVMLVEDGKRLITLDSLEMQYYRYLINDPSLENHLLRPPERIRYATSCRDVSSPIPQDFVAMQAAICSRTIHQVTSDEKAFLSIWCTDVDQMNVQRHMIPVQNPISCEQNEWTLCTDDGLMNKFYEARAGKLPNETGGVLVGTYDIERKIVYVVDCLPSPLDSKEWPTFYIRGCRELKSKVRKIEKITDNQLMYIGEWHSHPPGCEVNPSQADRKLFGWLSDFMKPNGLPPLMLIVGDPGKYAFYLERIE